MAENFHYSLCFLPPRLLKQGGGTFHDVEEETSSSCDAARCMGSNMASDDVPPRIAPNKKVQMSSQNGSGSLLQHDDVILYTLKF